MASMSAAASAPGAGSDPAALHRVILHLDLDAFYAQVEAARLAIPTEVPLVVQQWQAGHLPNCPFILCRCQLCHCQTAFSDRNVDRQV